jgi:ribose transport system permease protein
LLRKILEKFGISLILIVICIIIALQSPAFLTANNLFNVLLQVSINAIIAVGMTFVILTAGIDLSVGSLVALVAVSMGTILHSQAGIMAAVAGGLLVGVLAGGVNGFLVSKCRVPAFITTLGMMSVARGLALTVTRGQTLHQFPAAFRFAGNGYIGPVPMPVIIALCTVLIAHYVLTQTRFGRHVYAVGGNREAVRLSGINVTRVEWAVYAIGGLTCAIGAIILVGRLNSAQPIAGYGYELSAIAAVVIGGTSLMGGTGTVFGTLIGALIMGVLQNGLTLMNVSSYIQQIIIGSVIVLAVLFDQLRQGNIRLPAFLKRTERP